MPGLFDPVTVGKWTLNKRIAMAPMTRNRANLRRRAHGHHGDVLRAAGHPSPRAFSPARKARAT